MQFRFGPRLARWILLLGLATVLATVILYCMFDPTPTGPELGDTFGSVGAVLTWLALFGVAASLHDVEKAREESDQEVKRQQAQINALAMIAQAVTDPAVVARVDLVLSTSYQLVIENLGRRTAYDIRFEVDPKEGLYPGDNPDMNLADLPFIRSGLPMMAPGQRIAAYVASGATNEDKRNKGEDYAKEMELKLTYYLDPPDTVPRRFETFVYRFSFDAQRMTFQPRGEVAEELHGILKHLKKVIKG